VVRTLADVDSVDAPGDHPGADVAKVAQVAEGIPAEHQEARLVPRFEPADAAVREDGPRCVHSEDSDEVGSIGSGERGDVLDLVDDLATEVRSQDHPGASLQQPADVAAHDLRVEGVVGARPVPEGRGDERRAESSGAPRIVVGEKPARGIRVAEPRGPRSVARRHPPRCGEMGDVVHPRVQGEAEVRRRLDVGGHLESVAVRQLDEAAEDGGSHADGRLRDASLVPLGEREDDLQEVDGPRGDLAPLSLEGAHVLDEEHG
jgi:hypothetical protein